MVQGRQRAEHHPAEADDLTPSARLVGLDHVQLAMPSGPEAEHAAQRFYGDVLGLERVPKPPAMAARGGCWFAGPGGLNLHLGVETPFIPARKAHPALLVDDLDSMAERVADAGHELVPATDGPPGVRRGHVHDPFGNRVELVEQAGPGPAAFERAADEAIFPLIFLDNFGAIVWASGSIERFFGYTRDDLVGQRFDVLISPESVQPVVEAFTHIRDAYEPGAWGGVGVPVDVVRPDGSRASCEVAAITRQRTGLPWYVVVIRPAGYERALDQTVAGMASGVSLGDVLARVATAIENMVPGSGVAVGDRWTGERFAVSAGNATSLLVDQPGSPWARALADQEDQLLEDLSDLPSPLAALARAEGYAACWVHAVSPALSDERTAAVIVWRRVPGPPTRFMWRAVQRAGRLLSLGLQWDRGHTGLSFAANHDPLTGLVNRQAFRQRLEIVAKAQIRSDEAGGPDGPDGSDGSDGSDGPGDSGDAGDPADAGGAGGSTRATVFYIDLDRFKPVNDHLGHLAGDQVLTVIAQRLTSALRPGDLAARMGGDEFAVLCERLSDREDAEHVATRLLEVIQKPISAAGHDDIRVDASIGLSEIRGGEPVDTVVASADSAMRAAKHAGRGHWRWFTCDDA